MGLNDLQRRLRDPAVVGAGTLRTLHRRHMGLAREMVSIHWHSLVQVIHSLAPVIHSLAPVQGDVFLLEIALYLGSLNLDGATVGERLGDFVGAGVEHWYRYCICGEEHPTRPNCTCDRRAGRALHNVRRQPIDVLPVRVGTGGVGVRPDILKDTHPCGAFVSESHVGGGLPVQHLARGVVCRRGTGRLTDTAPVRTVVEWKVFAFQNRGRSSRPNDYGCVHL
eukprot:gene3317-biopygen683